MKTLRNLLTILTTTGAIVTTPSSHAVSTVWIDSLPAWTATASSCTPDESSAGSYEFGGSQVRFLGSHTSSGPLSQIALPITVRCNVTPIYDYVPKNPKSPFSSASWISPNWTALIVGYKDPDGISTKTSVTASLKRVIRQTKAEATVATFDSNQFASVVANEGKADLNKYQFDFQNNDYYVEINLFRSDANVATPVAYTVRLANGAYWGVPH